MATGFCPHCGRQASGEESTNPTLEGFFEHFCKVAGHALMVRTGNTPPSDEPTPVEPIPEAPPVA